MAIAAKQNKVQFNLKNVYIAELFEVDGQYSYGTPKALPGAVNLSISPEGESNPFYADDIVYYRSNGNNGYTGTLELALVPDWFRQKYLLEILDTNGILVESSHINDTKYFAMLFEMSGDSHKTRHCLYKCSVTRPDVASQTRETSNVPVTMTLNLTCDPLEDGTVKVKTTMDTAAAKYSNWFNEVYIHTATTEQMEGGAVNAGNAKLATLTLGALTLSPSFDPDVTNYEATTTSSSNTITATGAESAVATITVNGSKVNSGSSATWSSGSNTVVITATKSGYTPTAYIITVTKE